MKKVLFVCHGNICRSPMAEMILRHLTASRGLAGYEIESAAVSREEIGNDVYPPARRELARHGVPCLHRAARQITRQDYDRWDVIIGMDGSNIARMLRIFGSDPQGKVARLMSFTGQDRDVADPWYSDRFDIAWRDILAGCEALLDHLEGAEK